MLLTLHPMETMFCDINIILEESISPDTQIKILSYKLGQNNMIPAWLETYSYLHTFYISR
jgi:hypothetical protein